MIHFVCICGEPFDVPAEMAGESFQCPACKRLVDVPLLGQTDSFMDDGTVKMAEAEETPSALGQKVRAFSQAADMRNDLETFLIAGTGDPATTPKQRATPHYDPITGELMLPLGIQNDDLPPPRLAVEPGAPVLGYARNTPKAPDIRETSTLRWWNTPWRILSGMSLMAMLIIWFVHVMIEVGLVIPGFNVFFLIIAFFLSLVLISHYCNTVEDFGPNDRDAVPVLLRGVSIGEDLIAPLTRFGLAAVYAFFPLLMTTIFGPSGLFIRHPVVLLSEFAWGMLVFPAALFTMICGGVIQNLWPPRVLSVVLRAPTEYVFAMLMFWMACATYLVALSRTEFSPLSAVATPTATRSQFIHFLSNLGMTLGFLAVAVYLMHLAAAWLGLIYRKHRDDFDWVLQQHERVNRTDVLAQLLNRQTNTPGRTAEQEARLQHVREADAARAGAKPVLPLNPGPKRHGGFEVKIK